MSQDKPLRGRTAVVLMVVVVLAVFWGFKRLSPHVQSVVGSEALDATPVVEATNLSCPEKLGSVKKVGIQVGHLEIDQVPDELSNLRWDFGASSNGVNEVDVNNDVAKKTVALLKAKGIQAEILTATVPEDYCASAFVAIHADGNDDSTTDGYKVAPSSWDTDGKAETLSDDIQEDYGAVTGMDLNGGISDNMTQYYAFNYQRFRHSIDAHTPGVLIEVGFVTNSSDRAMFTRHTDLLAQGLAKGIEDYLNGVVLTTPSPAEY